jgi:hypothetical protein
MVEVRFKDCFFFSLRHSLFLSFFTLSLTLFRYQSLHYYVRTMLKSMDEVKCWLKGIESDQGYQNYLFYNGHFNNEQGNATLFYQGTGVVNTIGALNGFR